jgi:branched-chain amino acid aminotransferase
MRTMADRDGLIWLDGDLVPWREAKVHVLTHTLHYGMGVFEGVRAYATDKGAAIFRLREHTDRLFNSAKILGMPMPYDRATLDEAQCAAVRENGLASAYIRPMCFYGSEGMGLRADNLQVHCMVAAWEWGAYLGEDNMRNGYPHPRVLLYPPPCQYHHVPGQGQRQLHEFHDGAPGGPAGWL